MTAHAELPAPDVLPGEGVASNRPGVGMAVDGEGSSGPSPEPLMEHTPTVRRYLSMMEGMPSASLADLARLLGRGKPAVTVMVQRLTEAGIVRRVNCSCCGALTWVVIDG